MAIHSTKTLADLVNKRLRCLTQLVQLGQRQGALIDEGETSALLRLLATKGQLITALQAIEAALAPFHAEDPEARVWESPAARANCAAEAQRCRELLACVMELEAANEQRAVRQRDDVAGQLRNLGAANRARNAYQAAAPHRAPAPKGLVPLPADHGSPQAAAGGLDVSSEV
ncbi:MAG: flagellar export chaperone FlgN [Planctomycetales bacterium]|nr:flagellar export chaperone FlgN [Planctomycetales bacterium]